MLSYCYFNILLFNLLICQTSDEPLKKRRKVTPQRHVCTACGESFPRYSLLVKHRSTHPALFLRECVLHMKYRPTSVYKLIMKSGFWYRCRKCWEKFHYYSLCRHHILNRYVILVSMFLNLCFQNLIVCQLFYS